MIKANKWCNKCQTEKSVDEFYKNRAQSDGLASECKSCRKGYSDQYYSNPQKRAEWIASVHRWQGENPEKVKVYRRRRTLSRKGLTEQEYDQMLIAQDYSCAICESHIDNLDKMLCVDHCHISGQVRGLLCNACNIGLGFFKDSPVFLRKAVLYLDA